jgi:hypothetical protein
MANLAQTMRRDREAVSANTNRRPRLVRHCARERGPSIPETPVIESISRGVLDPRFRGDDDGAIAA